MMPLLGLATATEPAVSNGATSAATLASMMGGLVLVLVLIFFLAYIVRKLNLAPSSNGAVKTLATAPLGQKERLVLVEVGKQQYLLGVSAQQVNLIDKLSESVEIETQSFAEKLKQASAKS